MSGKWLGGRVQCRCKGKGRHRKTFNQPPDWYKTPPVCFCGKEFNVDGNRNSGKEREHNKQTGRYCTCSGIDDYFYKQSFNARKPTGGSDRFPKHKKGSKGCIHREDSVIEKSLKDSTANLSTTSEAPF